MSRAVRGLRHNMQRQSDPVSVDSDDELMLSACHSMFRSVLGNVNWRRLNRLKHDLHMASLHTLLDWIITLAETQQQADAAAAAGPHQVELSEKMEMSAAAISDMCPSLELAESTASQYFPAETDDGVAVGPSGAGNCVEIISTNDQASSFFCTLCQVTLSNMEIIEQHLQLQHPDVPLLLSCVCCPAPHNQFSSIPHYVTHHSQQGQAALTGYVVCKYCARTFKRKKNLEEHITLKHEKSSAATFQCVDCHKTFGYARSLTAHRKTCKYAQPM